MGTRKVSYHKQLVQQYSCYKNLGLICCSFRAGRVIEP